MSQNINSLSSICILRLSSIGDITHMIPVINTLLNHSPESNITWIIGKTEYELVKNIKGIEFIVFDKNRNFDSIKVLRKSLKGRRFNFLLHMQKSLRSRIISFFVRAEKKYNYGNVKVQDRYHVLDTFFLFLQNLGISKKILDWSINIDQNHNILKIKKDYVVLNPFTSSRRFNFREWEINNYIAICKYLSDTYDINSVIVGGKSNYEIDESKKIGPEKFIHNLVGKTNLQELYNILKCCKFYMGPDSGTLHIASMLRKPVIGLFATSNPLRTGPYNNMDYIVNKYEIALKKYNNKSINEVKWGARIRNNQAMSLITQKDVIDMIDKILGT
ncbi:MAG: glycosyltransferase family 9 protein [Pelagibacterales bacterium]|nr:glycosyltransferase family 9 protein [Pelagibacterales bacterium]